MNNAALFVALDAFNTTGARLLGRHSAGESFLRGFVRHADADRFWLYNAGHAGQAALDDLVARIEAPKKPVGWIASASRGQLAEPGVLHIPSPELPAEAWARRSLGSRTYAISGVTHTTASETAMDIICSFLIAPVEAHDALICTSAAVRSQVETQLAMMRDYMQEAYGPRRRPEPQRVTIPLGVNASDFAPSPADRKAWRERLELADDAIVALYVGRFNVRGKMNPALMAMALERAAQRTGRPIVWLNSGWTEAKEDEAAFHAETRKLCPSVDYRHVDGRRPETRFSIWAAADIFISFSDNIQETFGLTPIEAMAAGLPCVVSDWDGYKDTVRDGVDGFRIPTIAPRPGLGADIAFAFANRWMSYENYIGASGQFVAVDLGAAEEALAALIEQPELRRRMGEAGRARAREVFDWAAIVPQYQALWAEQNARRQAAPDNPQGLNPYRPDPFTLFASYPTRPLGRADLVSLTPGVTAEAANAKLAAPIAIYSRYNRPSEAEVAEVVAALQAQPVMIVAEVLERFAAPRRALIERGLIWLARHDILSIRPAG